MKSSVLSMTLALVAGVAFAAAVPAEKTISLTIADYAGNGYYRYCPTVFVDGEGVRHAFYCHNRDKNVTVDYIYHATVDAAGNLSNEVVALSPCDTTGTGWDSYHVCDPSVIDGAFFYNGHTYKYLMAYLGVKGKAGDNSSDGAKCINNKVGFAVSDNLAAETLVAAERAGLRVPEDLSVVGVDDNPEICENCEPTLTSVRPDFHQLGFAAAKTLQARIVSPHRKNESGEIPPVGLVRRASSGASEDACVSRALEKIRLQACEGLSVADVAALFGDCSRRSAELRFKAATGMTMTEALLEIRLSRASDYLRDGLSVDAVANFCGWKSDIPFRKAFKRKYGILPSDIRRRW